MADCAIRNAPEDATEKQIGIRIFHRNPGYNSSEDSIVRTHARLLRQKLAAYFAEEGASEEVVVEIPKGHYLPVFHGRERVALSPAQPPRADELPPPIPLPVPLSDHVALARPWSQTWRSRTSRGRTALILVLLPVLVVAVFFWRSRATPANQPGAVERFWRPFLTEDPPLVIFSNAVFVGDSKNGLRYAETAEQRNTPEDSKFVDTYTGIGELASVYTLTTLFDAHRSHFILKRSLLMTWDEAKTKNLIFIGSVAENPSLRVLQSTSDFTITASPGSAGVVNHHPKPGEPAVYSRPDPLVGKDYAVLALLPAIQPGKRILVFSGLTTFGTQAAVDYVCRPESAAELLRLITTAKGEIRPFEAVLETTVGGGVPLQTRLITLRQH